MTELRVILVTGASSGIGRACAQRLRHDGHYVYGTSRNPSESNLLAMDVTDDASVQRAIDTILQRERHIDVVVNNAGIAFAGAIEDTSIEEAKRQLETNFFGALRVTQAVLPHMRARRCGLIVNISSLGGLIGLPFQGLYAASKFALEGLTESLRHEVRPFGIQVSMIEPGDIRTPITANRHFAVAAQDSAYAPYFRRALEVIEKEERGGAPAEEVAEVLAQILRTRSPALRYTAGNLGQTIAAPARRILPSRIFETIIASMYGLRQREPTRAGTGTAPAPVKESRT